ncbi:circadian clock-controlled protein daywake-like [Euwallacea fornicatus]|uniref:circadian clock-controlled protein daywake-like n=1 Tax=Euwallacea fornicatus TaxID=995702 RepID=UPI00338E97E8
MTLSLYLIGFISFCSCTAVKLPSYIKICSMKDPNFSACAVESARNALPKLIHGEPKLGLPPLRPLSVPQLTLLGRNNLKLAMTELKVSGLENLEFLDFRVDTASKVINIKSFDRQIEILAHCNINGQIFFFPLRGAGPCKFTFIDGNYSSNLAYELEKRRDGKKYLKINKKTSTFRYTLGKAKFDLEKLFSTQEIGEQISKLVNNNWKILNEEMRHSIEEALLRIVVDITRLFTKNIPSADFVL